MSSDSDLLNRNALSASSSAAFSTGFGVFGSVMTSGIVDRSLTLNTSCTKAPGVTRRSPMTGK